MTTDQKLIRIRGAGEHNLQSLDVDIPRDGLVVITGVSGSGKSSLAFDTIFAEGQRKYMESLSAYARQFLAQMQKPDVELPGEPGGPAQLPGAVARRRRHPEPRDPGRLRGPGRGLRTALHRDRPEPGHDPLPEEGGWVKKGPRDSGTEGLRD